jgi:hypothetical protein
MCCFSGTVRHVVGTRIFARMEAPGVQSLAYAMRFTADRPVAMILPLPVAPLSAGRAVSFVNLKNYPEFFAELDRAFPQPVSRGGGMAGGAGGGGSFAPPLPVYAVGDFVASFVPTQADFGRVDPRFHIAPEAWAKLPEYADFGFAVFQLRADAGKETAVHPIALRFLTRYTDRLFFPTVHIHDGEVHEREGFDHELFCQGRVDAQDRRWWASPQNASRFVDARRASGLVDPNAPIRKMTLRGTLPNRDTYAALC